jgi:hypothetical protein
MSNNIQYGFVELTIKTIIVHTLTYTFMGIIVYKLFKYTEAFAAQTMDANPDFQILPSEKFHLLGGLYIYIPDLPN